MNGLFCTSYHGGPRGVVTAAGMMTPLDLKVPNYSCNLMYTLLGNKQALAWQLYFAELEAPDVTQVSHTLQFGTELKSAAKLSVQ